MRRGKTRTLGVHGEAGAGYFTPVPIAADPEVEERRADLYNGVRRRLGQGCRFQTQRSAWTPALEYCADHSQWTQCTDDEALSKCNMGRGKATGWAPKGN